MALGRDKTQGPAIAIAVLVFGAFAVVSTWPLSRYLDTHLPGSAAFDNVTFLWSFWWVRTILASAGDLFHTGFLFHPFGTGLAMHTHAFFNAFVGATLFADLPIVQAQNLVLVGSIALNGVCAYLLAWWLTRHRAAALVAGLYFVASPYFPGHLQGHFNLVPAWTLPLFALTWLRSLDRTSPASAVAAGVVFAAAAWTDYYYAAYLVAFALVVVAVRWVGIRWIVAAARPRTNVDRLLEVLCLLLVGAVVLIRITGGGVFFVDDVRISATTGLPLATAAWGLLFVRLWRVKRPWPAVSWTTGASPWRDLKLVGLAGSVAAAGTFPILREAVALLQSGSYMTPPGFLRSAAEGVDPLSLVSGNPFHPLWGGLISRFYAAAEINVVENTAYVGLVVLVTFVLTRGFSRLPPATRLWRVTAVVFLIWALGPYLRVLGENTGLYLPAALLRLLPAASNLRIPGRAMVMVYLSLSVLLAYALSAWSPRRGRGRLPLAAAVVVVIADFAATPPPLLSFQTPAVYRTLAGLPHGAVLELPMGIRDGFAEYGRLDHRVLVYQATHGKPIVGGFVARMTDTLLQQHLDSPLFGPLLDLSAGTIPDAETLERLRRDGPALLRSHGIRYIVLAEDAAPVLRDVVLAWPLARITDDGGLLLEVP